MAHPLAFDNHQFERHSGKAVSAESGIAFSDYQRMRQFATRKRHGHFPEHIWANDDTRLRTVLAHYLWRTLQYSDNGFPQGFFEHSFKEFCMWLNGRAKAAFQHSAQKNPRWK